MGKGWPERSIRPAPKKSVQQQQSFFFRVVAVAHGLHESHVLTHHRAKKTAETRSRPQCFERRIKGGIQQRLHNRLGPSLPIFSSQVGERVVGECTPVYHPVQETVDKTSTIRNRVEGPHPDSIVEPLSHHFLRHGFTVCMLGEETVECIKDVEVSFG
jgi:hypothetical protein